MTPLPPLRCWKCGGNPEPPPFTALILQARFRRVAVWPAKCCGVATATRVPSKKFLELLRWCAGGEPMEPRERVVSEFFVWCAGGTA